MNSLVISLGIALACMVVPASSQSDLAPLKVTTNIAPSPGFLYLAPNSRVNPRPYQPYLAIYNTNGGLVKSAPASFFPFEFKVLPDGRLAFSELIVFAGTSAAAGITVVDTLLQPVESLRQWRGYLATQHDFHTLPNGNRVILGAEDVTLDLTGVVPNGNPAANVVQAVVQEMNAKGDVLVQWKSLDYLPITLSYEDLTAPAIRYIHNNAMWIDDDGNWLLSMRHTSSIVKVNRLTRDVMWILGGKANEFTFLGEHEENAPTYFSYQHDIRRLPNGHITLFDNGTQHSPQYSRAVEYEIDEVNKTCRLVWEYRHTPDIYVGLQGGVQTLPDGHRLIGWGSAANEGAPGVTEVDSAGTVVFEAYYPKQMFVYRATKHPFWPPGRASANVTIHDVAEGGEYRYSGAKGDVGIRVRYNKLNTFFYNTTTARRFMWAPLFPKWLGSEFSTEAPDAQQVRVDLKVEGIQEHEFEVRFNVDTLGLADIAERITVYRRDFVDSVPELHNRTFVSLPTTYDAVRRVLVVATTTAGEFAFGVPAPDIQNRALILKSPINGERVLELSPTKMSVSIPGRADSIRVVVSTVRDFNPTEHPQASTVVFDSTSQSDHVYYPTPGAERMMYWRAVSILNEKTVASNVDSFLVAAAFINVERPADNAVWTIDSSYVISWTTNITGLARIELVHPGLPTILIKDSARVTARGFLWRLPLTLSSGEGYQVRITSLEEQFAGVVHTSPALITINGLSGIAGDGPLPAPQIRCWPQPASDRVWFDTPFHVTSMMVFDIQGNLLKTVPHTPANMLDVADLAAGVWTVALGDSYGRYHLRTFMVQR